MKNESKGRVRVKRHFPVKEEAKFKSYVTSRNKNKNLFRNTFIIYLEKFLLLMWKYF